MQLDLFEIESLIYIHKMCTENSGPRLKDNVADDAIIHIKMKYFADYIQYIQATSVVVQRIN